MIVPWGALVHTLTIARGGLVGMLFGARLPERFRSIVFQALGFCVLVSGLNRTVIFSRAIIDGFAATALASAYGAGVLFPALPVLICQETLIVGIGLNMPELVRIPLSNVRPPLPRATALATFFA